MDKSEIEKTIGKYIDTPVGRQLLAGYQIGILLQGKKLVPYPKSVVLICWSDIGGVFHHDVVDCRIIEEREKWIRK